MSLANANGEEIKAQSTPKVPVKLELARISLANADGEEIKAQSTPMVPVKLDLTKMSLATANAEEIEAQSIPMVPGEICSQSIDEWAYKLMNKNIPSSSPATQSSDSVHVMFTAPESMRSVGIDDIGPIFDPRLVSIGPFHHNKFPAMEEHKTHILTSMLSRDKNKELLSELVNSVKSMEVKSRGYYSKAFEEIDFAKMMVIDGCFILEVFRMHAGLYTKDGDDPIFSGGRWMLPALALDMVKLENQLPYFVLEELHRMTRRPNEPPLNRLAGTFLTLLWPGLDNKPITVNPSPDHLLALFHSTFPYPQYYEHLHIDEENCNLFPSVTDLRLSGIKVVRKEPSITWWNLLEICYYSLNRILMIPTLVVDHSTIILMRNLVAYEQCNKRVRSIFTSYVTFIGALVNSAEDVEALRVAGVISHSMNSNEEVSKLLNNLTANIKYDMMNEGYLAGINKKVYDDHYIDRFKHSRKGEIRPEEASSSSSTKPKWMSELLMSCDKITNMKMRGNKFPIMFTAPENMRLVDRDDAVFDPVLVSIGPFHHNKFPAMEDHKTRILSSMLCRLTVTNSITSEKKLIELVDAMKVLEVKVRVCYHTAFPGIDFPKMMVYDGCFILEIFRMHAGLYPKYGDDPIFFARWMLPVLALDIVKLENQIPYHVLEILYHITKSPDEKPLDSLAVKFLSLLCPPGLFSAGPFIGFHEDHLLSLFHSTFISRNNYHPIRIHPDDDRNCNSFPSVTDLRLSGIKVVKKKAAAAKHWDLLDIEYRNHKLEVPTLVVDHSTKTLMRNLVAYEQCNKTVPSRFTSYVTFIDALVNSAEDVEALRVAGVISHFMNSNEEVNKLLNNLTANIRYNMNEGYLADLNLRVYSDHHRALPQLTARFRRLVNSREGIVYIVTVFALYLTVLQSVFAVLSYFGPKG